MDLSNVDQVPSNARLSEKESQLYIFEDNEAVIKMIIRGRSPTMRHVSWTWEERSTNSGCCSVQHASGNREYMRKVVQNMKDRLGHNENVSEISMDSEKMHISTCDLWLHRCRVHYSWTRITKRIRKFFKNSEFENILSLFSISRMMIEGNSEIKNVFSADVASSQWENSVLLNCQAIKWTKTRVYVCSDSVLCLGKQHGPRRCNKRWNDQVSPLKMCHTFSVLQELDGEPIDFEWKIFPGAKALGYSPRKFRQICKESTSNLKISVIG